MRKLLICFLLIYSASWSQDVDLSGTSNDYQFNNQIWFKFKAVLPVNKKTDLSVQYISRVYFNGMTPGSYFYLSGKHNFKKWLVGDMTTRFVADRGHNFYRLEAGLKVKKKVKDFQFSYRTAWFAENKTIIFTRDMARSTFYFWRNRVGLSWSPKKKWEFGTSFETWNVFNYRHTGKLDKACVALDVEYQFSKRHAFKFAYQNQFDIQQANKTSLNMYILGYEYTFKKLKKKK
ncbi:hypothetical protein D3C87_196610 [compost metagenome]